MLVCVGLTLSGEHSDGYARITELDERSSLADIQAVSGQQNVLGAHEAMDQLLVLLHTHNSKRGREREGKKLLIER